MHNVLMCIGRVEESIIQHQLSDGFSLEVSGPCLSFPLLTPSQPITDPYNKTFVTGLKSDINHAFFPLQIMYICMRCQQRMSPS